jgi:hypothetical protein
MIHFNQQWVPDQTAEWFEGRGPLARAVVEEMAAAGIVVFAGGLIEEIDQAIGIDAAGNLTAQISSDEHFVGGLTIVSVDTDDEAHFWGKKIAIACGWPQEVRRFK